MTKLITNLSLSFLYWLETVIDDELTGYKINQTILYIKGE